MKRIIGYLAVALSAIGVAACVAGLIFIWVLRPAVQRSTVEILNAAGESLNLVEVRATQAEELMRTVRAGTDAVAGKVLRLTNKANRTPRDEKDLKDISEELGERLRQVERIAETAETAISLLGNASRLRTSLRLPGARSSTAAPEADDSPQSVEALSQAARELKNLRERVARISETKSEQNEMIESVVRAARSVECNLSVAGSSLQQVRERAMTWRTEVEEIRAAVPTWTNWTALVSSMVLAWIGLGQFMLMRWGRDRIRINRSA